MAALIVGLHQGWLMGIYGSEVSLTVFKTMAFKMIGTLILSPSPFLEIYRSGVHAVDRSDHVCSVGDTDRGASKAPWC